MWQPAKIVKTAESPRSYWVKKENGNVIRKNSFSLWKSGNNTLWNDN